jgi:hypothetical protein
MKSTILVTGDIVLDCHLYGGVKTAATSFSEPGTVYHGHLGGAVLTQKLLAAALDATGLAWDRRNAEYEAAKAKRAKENKILRASKKPVLNKVPRPDDLTPNCPTMQSRLGLKEAKLENTLPRNLHSFGVWTPHPKKKGLFRNVPAVFH